MCFSLLFCFYLRSQEQIKALILYSNNHMHLFYISTPTPIYIYSGLFVAVLDYEYLTIFLNGTILKHPYFFILWSHITLARINL